MFCLFVDIDECSSEPCTNGGTCTDGVNAYSCACVAGYSGEDCDIGNRCITKTLYWNGHNLFAHQLLGLYLCVRVGGWLSYVTSDVITYHCCAA